MDRPRSDIGEILDRLQPVLVWIFAAYGIAPERAARIVEESCHILIAKRPKLQEPAVWLLRHVIERCERSGEEEGFEDPPA
jgi:hypothetical protein